MNDIATEQSYDFKVAQQFFFADLSHNSLTIGLYRLDVRNRPNCHVDKVALGCELIKDGAVAI